MTTLKCQTHYATTLYAYTFYGSVLGGSMAPDVSIPEGSNYSREEAHRRVGPPLI